MGIESSIIKKKGKNHDGVIKYSKKNNNRNLTLDNKKVSSVLDSINKEDEKIDVKPQVKTVNNNKNRKTSEETADNTCNENIKNLKSLSVQNLVKLDNHNFEDGLPDSLETNCCSGKSKGEVAKILNEDLYDGMDGNHSFDEEDEEEENEEEEKDEEEKKKDLMVTNNIKTVFIDSKIASKDEHNEPTSEEGSNTSLMTIDDYELNFYRNGNDIRKSYLSKLVSTKVWIPNFKPKQHNSIIIFDWDDTLLPTSFLTPGGVFDENMKLPQPEQDKISKLEQAVLKLLTEAVEKGNVYIITNAGNGWVEYSTKRFYPSILQILEKIKIISARGEYEQKYPGNSRQWKIEAFLNLQKSLNVELVTNIICIGDSLFEMEAGRILASRFKEAFIKTIKFREAPKLDELMKQLKLVCAQFSSIYSSIKNLTIRVERKKKEGK